MSGFFTIKRSSLFLAHALIMEIYLLSLFYLDSDTNILVYFRLNQRLAFVNCFPPN